MFKRYAEELFQTRLNAVCAVLSSLQDEEDTIRLYMPENRKLSWRNGRNAVPWFSNKESAKKTASGSSIDYDRIASSSFGQQRDGSFHGVW